MSSTRERVLKTLLANHRSTINELAESVGINPISVRHHINKLEAEGLVDSDEELHGVGRPRRVYFLTEDGMERFPTRYMRLTVRILQQLKETLPRPMVKQIFSDMAKDLADDYLEDTDRESLAMEERLELLKRLLAREGFTVEWEQKDDQYFIREINCPYLHVGQKHPEICMVDQTLISQMLSVPAEKVNCVLNGDSHCTYMISSSKEKQYE